MKLITRCLCRLWLSASFALIATSVPGGQLASRAWVEWRIKQPGNAPLLCDISINPTDPYQDRVVCHFTPERFPVLVTPTNANYAVQYSWVAHTSTNAVLRLTPYVHYNIQTTTTVLWLWTGVYWIGSIVSPGGVDNLCVAPDGQEL